ncbi:hypothetical protein OSB04_019300 [Centaurea solstitialis]|uniref:PGG domain-containing protein n=1 Tax=Centaurea solstitialis TaxID=347529 RepID=A0AA38W2R5_9ASTR|nr:hypothetical protein OSB04_019300 [Centaurea solstitialis]
MDRNLFEASITGNVQVLNALLQEDNFILDRVPLTCFNETPLAIAAMKGHLDFVRILLSKKPSLAVLLDSQRRTPLHLASAEGYVEIVRELLHVMGPEGCGFRDQDGRTPLHLAAMNERLEVIEVLIEKRLDLGREIEENGESILHVCISYNRFEAMKLLSKLWNEEDLAKLIDGNGNTLLHVAVIHKQIQTVKYLLQKSSIIETGSVVNQHGLTALDVLDHCPRDLGALEIQSVLMEANILRAKDVKPRSRTFQASIESKYSKNVTNTERKPRGCMSRVWNWYLNDNGNWLEKQRGILILAAVVVATASFYSALHPPGGTFSDSKNGPLGNAVQTEVVMDDFSKFLIQNTIIMVLSMLILMVLLSGIPLRNKFCLWVLNLATLCIMLFMIITYLQEIAWMSPDTYINTPTIIMCAIWILLCLLLAFIHTVFFITWVIKKVWKTSRITRNKNKNSVGL